MIKTKANEPSCSRRERTSGSESSLTQDKESLSKQWPDHKMFRIKSMQTLMTSKQVNGWLLKDWSRYQGQSFCFGTHIIRNQRRLALKRSLHFCAVLFLFFRQLLVLHLWKSVPRRGRAGVSPNHMRRKKRYVSSWWSPSKWQTKTQTSVACVPFHANDRAG